MVLVSVDFAVSLTICKIYPMCHSLNDWLVRYFAEHSLDNSLYRRAHETVRMLPLTRWTDTFVTSWRVHTAMLAKGGVFWAFVDICKKVSSLQWLPSQGGKYYFLNYLWKIKYFIAFCIDCTNKIWEMKLLACWVDAVKRHLKRSARPAWKEMKWTSELK